MSPAQRRSRSRRRLLILFLLATPLGAMLGVLNLVPQLGQGGYTEIAAIFGAAAGLLTSPAPAFFLRRKKLPVAIPVVYGFAALLSLTGGFVAPITSAPVVIAAFLGACAVGCIALPNADPADPFECLHCSYDLRGLPSRTCPECGHDNAIPPQPRAPHPGNPYEQSPGP